MNGSLRTANLSIIGKCSFSGNADRNGKFEYPTLIYPHLFVGRGVNHWGDGMQVLSSCATCLIRKYECMHAHLYYRSICSKSSALRLGSASFLLAVFDSCSQTFFRVRFQSLIIIYWSFKKIASSRPRQLETDVPQALQTGILIPVGSKVGLFFCTETAFSHCPRTLGPRLHSLTHWNFKKIISSRSFRRWY